MGNEVRERLDSQRLAQDYQSNKLGNNGDAKIYNFAVAVNQWQQLLPINTGRRALSIQNLGGDAGYCRVEMALDRQNRNATFDVDDYRPRFIPTNAIFVYVSDPLATGSTVVNVQVIEG